ncbi:hypothetical protein [Sporisorium scitamineum]|uniref:NDT80 domain-containing protein n=1 Tax=Sporisorium scitamineum TaxID=49012 RepID=A0A0F7RWJ6_9BASI|nr:hypothetical protein [Sporisorium scitamineum]
MDSSSRPLLADQALSAEMETPTRSYKDGGLASLLSSPPSLPLSSSLSSPPSITYKVDSPAIIRSQDLPSPGASSKRPSPLLIYPSSRHHNHDKPHHLQAHSSDPTPPSSTTRCDSSATSSGHFDWNPILLFTPPPSSHSSKLPSSPAGHPRDTSDCFRSPQSAFHHQLNRNAVWQNSPTLSTRRARKLSQHMPLSLMSDRTALNSAVSGDANSSMSLNVSSEVMQSSPGTELSGRSPSPLGIKRTAAKPHESLKMMPSTKRRALTLDGTNRPVLPPLLGHHYHSNLGPIRTSIRRGVEYRSNPYFVSTPARKQTDYFSLSPISPRGAREHRATPLFQGPRTPTSSIRSTSSDAVRSSTVHVSPSNSRAFLGAPFKLDALPVGPRSLSADAIKKEDDGGSPSVAFRARLPSSHLATPDNVLGLFLEPNPFPSELLRLDLGPAAHCGPANTRNSSRMLTRSPANISETSSQLPSPSTGSDDSLTLLPLTHRHDLNKSNTDPSLDLPALRLNDSSPQCAAPSFAAKPVTKNNDNSFIYKMPILRAMSPLADLSSDNDSEDQDSDEPLIGSSIRLSAPRGSTIAATSLSNSFASSTRLHTSALALSMENGLATVETVDVSFHFEDEQGRRRDEVQGDLICEANGRAPFVVERFAVHMTAHIVNSDGRLQKGRQGLVPLIQFGPARERGPREAVQPVEVRSGGTISKDGSVNEQAATRSGTIAAFRRVQIRSATMNNGQRGAASQQFYALKLTLLAYPRQGAVTVSGGVEVASLVSHPITVRGRSKVHYAHAATDGTRKKEPAVASTAARRSSVTPSTSKDQVATTSSRFATKRGDHARNSSSMSPDQRRSSRRLLAAVRATSHEAADTMQDADDELEEGEVSGSSNASQRPVGKVMDIRSII